MTYTADRQLKMPLNAASRRASARAFTLIEILIVVALTAVLFALLLVPLISALRATQQAQLVTAAQDAARSTKERITRELGSAVFVFDGTSHPFVLPAGKTLTPGDDAYTNFLDLQILDSAGNPAIAHAYNAKLDFVLPKLNAAGGTTDPTTNEPIAYTQSQNGSAIISNPSYVFPLAAGTTMIRYFIGLKDPTISYNNTHDGKAINSDDNTYVLYRAEFQPYIKNGNSVVPNPALFAARNNSSGTAIPELDDPDFFRYVGSGDTDWLDDMHPTYGATTLAGQDVASHNARVDKWRQISKPVIPGPDVDLLLLPHNADNTLAYDSATGAFPNVAHSGVATDPVTAGTANPIISPIVNTSCTFRPATISGNATPGTTAEYNSQGSVSVDQSGFSYIPTVYTATSQSWSLPFHVGVYPANYNAAVAEYSTYYDTSMYSNTDPTINPGDVVEYRHTLGDINPSGTLVYDVTQGFPTAPGAIIGTNRLQFVPMTINPDMGTILFSAPSLPNGTTDKFTRTWYYAPVADAADPSQSVIDLTQSGYTDLKLTVPSQPSPLTDATQLDTTPTTITGVENAHPVPGSVRVYGPDQASGPNNGQMISYTEVNSAVGSSATGTIGENQYAVDYAHNILDLAAHAPGPIGVIYDYQANMTLTAPLPVPPSTVTPTLPLNLAMDAYLPMQVKVDYQTRDLIDVSIGVRIYDISTNRAQIIPAETKIKVGNSNR